MELLHLRERPTQDIDVLGCWDSETMSIACIDRFPEELLACINRVTGDHPELSGMRGGSWVNLGPRALAKAGLPEGCLTRLQPLRIGNRLTLHLLGRQDLIALKLYAAADDHDPRQEVHFADLKAMAPTFDELDFAVGWLRTRRDFEEKRLTVKYVLQRLGHDDLAYYV